MFMGKSEALEFSKNGSLIAGVHSSSELLKVDINSCTFVPFSYPLASVQDVEGVAFETSCP